MNYQMHVLINGRIADRYLHDGNWYIEGRKGTDYKIRLSNLTGKRTLFVPSVDGLSIIDGKTASKDSKGYILGPWQTLDVDGWLVDENTAAKFTFGHKNSSYSKESGHGTDNTLNINTITNKVFL